MPHTVKHRMRLKHEILHKAQELEDGAMYLRRNGKTPLTADEYSLKAEALRWALGERDRL